MSQPATAPTPPEKAQKEEPDILLCRRLATSAGKPEAEADCLKALKDFGEQGDFNKTADALAKLLSKTKDEVVSMVAAELKTPQTKPVQPAPTTPPAKKE